jgi:hypothetical protein
MLPTWTRLAGGAARKLSEGAGSAAAGLRGGTRARYSAGMANVGTGHVERLRAVLLHALGVAVVLPGCSSRPVGEGSGEGDGSSSSSSQGTASEGSSGEVTEPTGGASSGASSGATTEGVLECQPDPMVFCETLVCVPKDGECPVACDDGCEASEAFAAAVDACFATCGYDHSTVCGPEEQDGTCCYLVHIEDLGCPGRPLRVAAATHVAGVAGGGDWCGEVTLTAATLAAPGRAAAAERWTRAALDEHASVAAFARSMLQLLGLGAPAGLIDATRAALADEVEHARVGFAVASALAGREIGPGPLPAATGVMATSATEVALATFAEGCVGETIAAAIAGVAAARCEDPGLQAALQRIADDELRHAALAWRSLQWLLALPGVAGARAALSRATEPVGEAGADDPGLTAFGCLGRGEERRIAGEVWRSVIRPCLQAALRERTDAVMQPAV